MDDVERSDYARQILDNPLFVDAFAQLRADLARQRLAVDLKDIDAQRTLILSERVTEQFHAILTRAVQAGEIAQFELAHKKSPLQRVFRR